ncbi:MAG: IS5 family transposase [Epsilonproteobacteria bacterium]|nr:IS5 family transposase [Campylobacterota bacterium]
MSFNKYILSEQYKKVKGLGDRLELMKHEINWSPFVPIIKSIFHDNEIVGGRPHTDEIMVVRILLLQGWYGLTDPELEFQINDRLSFRNFIGFPEKIPDFSTIWRIRERLQNTGKDKKIWQELQNQIDIKGYKIQKGVIQDATFIDSDLGKKRYAEERKAKKEDREIVYSQKQESHIDRDAKFAIKNNQIHFGYKNHIKVCVDYFFIRNYEITSANIHDNNIDLVEKSDIAAYRDRGYSGKELKYACVEDKTMIRKDKKKEWVIATNKAISKIRCQGERPFAVIKNVFNGSATKVKTLVRVSIKEMFKCFAYNLYNFVTIGRRCIA